MTILIEEDELTLQTSNQMTPQSTPANAKLSPDRVSKPGGLGLKNTEKRLNLLYPDKHSLLIDQHDDSFDVILTLHFPKK